MIQKTVFLPCCGCLRTVLMTLFVAVSVTTSAQIKKYSLNSSSPDVSWTLCPRDNVKDSGNVVSTLGYSMPESIPAIVPGVVFASYVEAGKEKCPEYADNIYKVDERKYNRPYWYRTEFATPEAISSDERVYLNCDNTNRYAEFYLNGQKISGTATSVKDVSGHMMRSCFDITNVINKSGKNALAVLIYDPDQKKTRTDSGPYGVACSPSYLAGAGWDWMPYVPGRLAGITGKIYLTTTRAAKMCDPWVRSNLKEDGRAEINILSDVKNASSERQKVTLSGVIMPGNVRFSKTVSIEGGATKSVKITRNDVPSLSFDNPKLWWPNGYGDQNLYTCKLECTVNGTVSDARTVTFGIRKYDYRIEHNAVGYPVLNLYVNGKRIFAKGGNWGMSEYLLRCHDEQYDMKIRLHKEMNYNMIRLWTGCVTDEEFYDYCDKYGIMVWDNFWLYVAYNDVAEPDAFKANARDKVRRLRNHACIAVWCGANETHPNPDLDSALRMIVMEEDGNDRMYKSCSNQDAMSGSGWWKDLPPRHHFETSASNLAFNKPAYPYGTDYGYGFRSEIGMATFPSFESVSLFIPKESWWPLPTDEQLKDQDDNVWNRHFFGKEAWNGGPIDYKHSVNERYGESSGLEEFCEKAQLINLEDMRGMYEAWNDKMWNDAAAMLIWMSHPAYPSFVWQTYDYYYDPTGAYWGAKKACEPRHIQWNCLTNSVKVINSTPETLRNVVAKAEVYDINGQPIERLSQTKTVALVEEANIAEAFTINFDASDEAQMRFIRLTLTAADGSLLSENFYWRNGEKYDYTALNSLPEAKVKCDVEADDAQSGHFNIRLHNTSKTVAFANRLRLVNKKTGERVLPIIMSDNYITLMPGEERTVSVEADRKLMAEGAKVLLKQYKKKERVAAVVK